MSKEQKEISIWEALVQISKALNTVELPVTHIKASQIVSSASQSINKIWEMILESEVASKAKVETEKKEPKTKK